MPPSSFLNGGDDLVGLDLDMAHALARGLGVSLELVPVGFLRIAGEMSAGCRELLMGGTVVTPERAAQVTFSDPYLEEHRGFLAPDHQRSRFRTLDSLRSSPPRVGSFGDLILIDRQTISTPPPVSPAATSAPRSCVQA